MALVSKSISNLIGGVSQQPDSIRFDNQCQEQDNAYPSVLEGLVKRPPTEHVANINASPSGNASDYFVHTINRDASSQYLATMHATTSASSLKVNKLDGTAITITEATTNALDYLKINAASTLTADTALRAITIADYTFIVNRTKVVAMDTATTSARNPEALFFVKQGDYGTTYTATIVKGGTTYSTTVETGDGSSADHREDIATDMIAAALATGANSSSDFSATSLTVTTATGGGIHQVPDSTLTRDGSVIHIIGTNTTAMTVNATDGLGDTAFSVFKDSTQRLTDLPTNAKHDFILKIIGEATDTRDDYYVKFVADNGSFGAGVWEETNAPEITYKFDATTMPHVLIRKSASEYLFGACVHDGTSGGAHHSYLPLWGERNVGDITSNPDPTFVTKTINDIFLFKNRLGLLADENVILSETSEFFNFFKTTVTDLLDTAPIDVASTHSTVSVLTSAIPFHKQLVLFSEQTQFILGSGGALTPRTVSMTKTTSYESVSHIRPVSLGHSIYFGFNRGGYTGVKQYYITNNTEDIFDSSDITAQIPQYITGDLRDMAGSSHEDVLFLLTNTNRNTLYVYKFFDQGQERLQSSWSTFTFNSGDEILGIEFIDTTLYMVVKRADGIFIDKLRMDSGLVDSNSTYRSLLDRRTDESVASRSYNSTTGDTTITLPYKAYTAMIVEMITKAGQRVPIKTQTNDSNQIVVSGDYSGTSYWIGQKYEMAYTFSDVVLKEPSEFGGNTAITEGRIQVRYLTVSYSDTGYFTVEVTPDYRDKSVHPFTGRILGSGNNLIGSVPLEDGDFRVPIYSKANQVKIEFKNDTPLPCSLVSAEFELDLNARSQRFR